jgi:hypothetical protein
MTVPPLRVARAEISLRAHSRAFSFVFAVGCLTLFMASETLLVGLVSSFETPSVGRWLLPWDADDPRLHDRLGQACRDTAPSDSLRYFRRAIQLSPASRLYWEDLELACESQGDTLCADQAGERLVQLCPMVPYYHWLAAQSSLRKNQFNVAYDQFWRLLELDPAYAAPTLASLQDVQKPEAIFQHLLAGRRDAKLKVAFVDTLSSRGDNDTAYSIWRRVAADSGSFPFSSAVPYLDRLIDLGRIQEAVNVWQDLERLGVVKKPEANEDGNLVFNGDFERTPLNAGFDWRVRRAVYLAADFSAPGAYRGAHCLRLDFTVGCNEEYEPVFQIVPVLSLHAYTLQAFVRAEDITSDSGPRLRVTDTQPGGFADALSETTVGTTPWHAVRLSFSTGPQTHAVRLSVWRPRSRVFPTEISGTCWLDAVSLKSATSDE